MSKQNIHIRVDNSVYLALKSKNVNVSSTVNDLLRSFVDQEDINTEKSEVLDNIAKLKANINSLNDKLKSEIVKLQIIEEKENQEEKEHDKKVAMLQRSVRLNNPLRDLDL